MTDTYILDANAFLAYFGQEPGADKVRLLLTRAEAGECSLYIHAINAYEVYYQFYRDKGEIEALQLWADINALPVGILYTFDEDFVKTAGRFKADFKISVADSFLLAQAHLIRAEVVTSDHHELDAVDRAGIIKFYWYR